MTNRISRLCGGMIATLATLAIVCPSQAAIIATGDFSPTNPSISPWNSSTAGCVAYLDSSTATLTINGGDDIVSLQAALGYGNDSNGTVMITGAGSTWTASGLAVGGYGTGSLTIANGGEFDVSSVGYIGLQAGSTGNVMVTGAGSSLTSKDMAIGCSGTGSLTVSSGATFTSQTTFLGLEATGTGTATITGTGSNWTQTGTSSLHVGYSGTGSLTVSDGATFTSQTASIGEQATGTGSLKITGTGSSWTQTGEMVLGHSGTGSLIISGGGNLTTSSSGISYLGYNAGSTGNATVDGAGSNWTLTGDLGVGHYGTGSLAISNGATVSARQLVLAYQSGSKSSVTITGTGTSLTLTGMLGLAGYGDASMLVAYHAVVNTSGYVFVDGAGGGKSSLIIKSGGVVNGVDGGVQKANATITGPGSMWTASNMLGAGAGGTLTIADGGKATAATGIIVSGGTLNLRVTGNNMLVLGNSTATGTFQNDGTVNLYASAFQAPGAYTPISDSQGGTLTWNGTGSYNGVGGTWNSTTHQFTVVAATNAAAGSTQSISDYQRIIFTDGSYKVGMSFGDVASGATASASYMTASDLAGLSLSSGESVLSAWNFTASGFGGEVLLSYLIGANADGLEVWHYDGTTWTLYNADDLIYDANGVASFTVNSFSGYAITGTIVPEPATMGLLVLGGLAALRIRRNKSRQA